MIKNASIVVLNVLLIICLGSCFRQKLRKNGVLDSSARPKYITNGKKEIVFFPMHHIGKAEFYTDINHKLDSLLKEGYTIFLEGVGRKGDSLQIDTAMRKTARITGINFFRQTEQGGYIDTVNNTLMGINMRYLTKSKLVNQTKFRVQGPDSVRVMQVDASYVTLVQATENKFGRIELTEEDFKINSETKIPKPKDKARKQYFLMDYRNEFITNAILSQPTDKLVLVYGAKHFDGILKNLQAADSRYHVPGRK